MGDLLARFGKKVVITVIGVVITLAYWTMTGSGGGKYDQEERVPEAVFGGGGGKISLEIRVNQPAVLKATFSRVINEEDYEEEGISIVQPLENGTHQIETDVADDVYLYFEVGVPEAKVGAAIAWTVRLDGREIITEDESLTEPLKPRYAFFVQFEADDIAQVRDW